MLEQMRLELEYLKSQGFGQKVTMNTENNADDQMKPSCVDAGVKYEEMSDGGEGEEDYQSCVGEESDDDESDGPPILEDSDDEDRDEKDFGVASWLREERRKNDQE